MFPAVSTDRALVRGARTLLGLYLVPPAAARGDGRDPRPAATRSSCCRPAAASRCASRRRPSSAPGSRSIVSPLISLMKDQVDTLVGNGVPAACYNSSLDSATRRRRSSPGLREGRFRLLYVSPERLVGEGSDSFLNLLSRCAGQLRRDRRSALHQPVGARLPARVPPARPAAGRCCRASASTPTPRPRPRACGGTSPRSSGCATPLELVGSFDRPNLVYRVLRAMRT